jgi:predicted type IV restriction endonuclease
VKEAIELYVKRVRELVEHVGSEEAAKKSLIEPLFVLLGYDLTDPRECVLEFKADFGKDRSTKPVDYAFYKNGRPIFFVEAKDATRNLKGFDEQLGDYFGKCVEVKLGVLTNGVQWRFFTDSVHENKMDTEPFLKWDLLSDKNPPMDFLTLLQKSQFNPQLIRTFAEKRRNQNLLLGEMSRLLEPSSEFVRMAIQNIETRNLTERVVDSWKPVLASAIEEWAKQKMLSMALDPTELADTASRGKVETTKEELDAFAAIQSIIGPDCSIGYEDTATYFKVHLRDRRTWVMCRLYLNRRRPSVWFPMTVEEVQPFAGGFALSPQPMGWTCLTMDSIKDLESLGGLLRQAFDLQKVSRVKSIDAGTKDGETLTQVA